MPNDMVVRLPQTVVERLEQEARRLGIGLEEYVLELVLRNLDPRKSKGVHRDF